jgi:hypothetical protein
MSLARLSRVVSRARRAVSVVAAPVLASIPLASSPAISAAPPSSGALEGRYLVVSRRATSLVGRVETPGAPALRMDGILIGPARSGALHGRFVEIAGAGPTGGFHLEYEVVGQYVLGGDGVVRIEAQIYLDLASQGVPVYLHAGELQGKLSQPFVPESEPTAGRDEASDPRGRFTARIDWF